MYTGNLAFINNINARIQREWPGSPWKAYPNTPEVDRCVVANDLEEIASQVYMANYELEKWCKLSYWRPELTRAELEARKKARRTLHDTGSLGFLLKETRPSVAMQKRDYVKYVKCRKAYELLGTSKNRSENSASHDSTKNNPSTHRSGTRKGKKKKL